MLFLLCSLRNNLCSVSAPNRPAALSLYLYLVFSLFPIPSLHTRGFALCRTILELTIFALGEIIIQILAVSNTRDIYPPQYGSPSVRIKKF